LGEIAANTGKIVAKGIGGVVVGVCAVPIALVGTLFGLPTYFILKLILGPELDPPAVKSGETTRQFIDHVNIALSSFLTASFLFHPSF
jgi:hypothetical protein